ncbi:MAG: B12-binding domain-containing radical SAM protein [Chloroflexota bacterium]|jgi:anaerobic magnesium-protoporphyrin IX monomethyl ester cyclase
MITQTIRQSTANYPDAGPAIRAARTKEQHGVDVLLANPPSPDGAIWIRSQHRVGRRSRENMIWPQVSLAQLAAMIHRRYSVGIVDAIATRMSWQQYEKLLREKRPRLYLTQVTGPTLTNDMYGVFLAKSLGARTIAFGTHVTPMPRETMEPFPCLDFIIRGEPEHTFQELVDTLITKADRGDGLGGVTSWEDVEPTQELIAHRLSSIEGLVWRRDGEIVVNPDRPFIPNLDDLPLPLHRLLPLDRYRVPLFDGPYSFVVTSRGCPGGCRFCIKHVSYQGSVRTRSPENIQQELWELSRLGVRNVHMYADLFTADRDQVVGLCRRLIEEGPKLRWTCNSRVDMVDPEMLRLMGQAGCWWVSWGIESGNREILRRARKGIDPEKVERALRWAREAGIKNWGYFIIGLPGETESTIRETISFAKSLPLDLALFHIAAPHPGTPFFFEVMENGWFRPGTCWEEVDMDRSTVLDYPNLKAEELERWQRRAFREWALRPGPAKTYLEMLARPGAVRSALEVGLRHLAWARG